MPPSGLKQAVLGPRGVALTYGKNGAMRLIGNSGFVTVPQAALALGIRPPRLYRMLKTGAAKTRPGSNPLLISVSELRRLRRLIK